MGESNTDADARGRPRPDCAPAEPPSKLTRLLCPVLAAYATTLVVEWFARAGARPLFWPEPQPSLFLRDLLAWPTISPCGFVISYCFALGLTWLGAALFGRLRWGVAAMGILLLSLAEINRTKLIYIDAPLSPRDLAQAWYGAKFALHGTPTWLWALTPLPLLGLYVARGWLRRRIRTAGLSTSTRALLAGAALVLLGGSIAITTGPLSAAVAAVEAPVAQRHGVAESGYYQGFALTMATRITVPTPDPPEGYRQERIAAIAERFAATASSTPAAVASPATLPVQPSIILWLSESFWDINSIPDFKATPDPLVNYRRLTHEGSAFRLLAPGYGGPTSATMYELLTGMSHKFVPEGVDEYSNLIDKPVPSIAWLLRARGYGTLAIHADWGRCFRSPEVYPHLGFASYEHEVDFPDAPRRGLFVSDEFLTDHVIEKIESAGGPMLIFAASMQAHGPYVSDAYRRYDVQINASIPQPAKLQFRTYAQHLREADAALARLTDHFRKSRRPVVLVFFGDHLPPFGETFREIGFIDIGRDTTLQQRIQQHTTPALVWTNTHLSLPQLDTPVSAPQVTMQVARMLGIEHPFYTGMLDAVGRSYPGLSPRVCIRRNGQPALPQLQDHTVQDYELICYDSLFGQHFGWPRLFPEVPAR